MRDVKTKFPRGKVVRERYLVEELLGQGGFGAVYRVRDRRVKGNLFALKEIADPNRQQRENFLFEGEVLRRLDHQALPRVYRVFEDEKNHRLYLLMDYIAGPNLEQLRLQQTGKRFSLPRALRILQPIMEALSYLHEQHPPIIHRDIKPSNIIVPPNDEGAVLVDFGIAKEYDQDSTTTAIRHCSPGYGAPEQYVHGTSIQTDIYGFGATLYTLLTGEVPIDALYRITRISSKRADPLVPAHTLTPTVPIAISDLLQRSMEVNSADRFESIREFWQALQEHAGDTSDVDRVVEQALSPSRAEADQEQVPETPYQPLEVANLATASVSTPIKRVSEYREPHTEVPKMRSRKPLMAGVALLIIMGVLSGLILGTNHQWFSLQFLSHSTPSNQIAHNYIGSPTHLQNTATATPEPTATPSPTAQSTQAPTTPVSTSYPVVATTYTGTIHNTPASVDSTMSLLRMAQQGATISGYLSLGANLIGNGDFTGTVTQEGQMQFLVPSQGYLLPLFFQGTIHTDGSIEGTYCSYQNNQCAYNGGGYGTWNVQAA